jgi:hypothetical protein
MPTYFPRQTIDWRAVEEPAVFRRLSVSLVEMALLTGVVLRIIRALTFGGGRANWLLFGASMLVAILLLVGMTTAHLANFSLRKWLWRAPLFALVVTAGAMATSLLLIAMRREPEGTSRADFHDWPSMAIRFLLFSELTVCVWALILGVVIVLVRRSGVASGVEREPVDPIAP